MWWHRACPKCRGDLCVSNDLGGAYVNCVQCGSELITAEIAKILLCSAKATEARVPVSVPHVA